MAGVPMGDFQRLAWRVFFCFLFIAVGSAMMPHIAEAQDFMLTFEPTFRAEHVGLSIYNGNPTNIFVPPDITTIRSSTLGAVNSSWIIEELQAWGHNVPSERGVYIIERIDPVTRYLEGGTAVLGQNYDVAHFAFSGSATTTHSGSFSLPNLGNSGTPSGTYEIVAAELPATKDVYDPETDTHTISAFTDEDLGKILANDPAYANVTANISYSMFPAEFEYINDGPPPCKVKCYSNVLFLPGIEASRLYWTDVLGGGEKKLWEPSSNDDLHNLYLTPEGKSVGENVHTKKGDVVDELPGGENVYKSFIAKMDELKAKKDINDWEAVPYDWRLSLDDILSNGRYFINGQIFYSGSFGATTTPYITQELRHLAKSSKTGKVTIIAHSNGGLVAKRLTEILGAEASQLIDKMIFVAVPQAGTPMAIAAGLHGYDQQHLGGLINSEAEARTFSSTTPMLYNLLPSAQYFTYVDDPVVQFDPSLPDWIAKYGAAIHSAETLHTFLTDSFGRVDAITGDINQPIQMNGPLLSNAETMHADLDNWTPPTGISLIQIAGWGVPKTVTGIAYKKGEVIKKELNFTVDGDGTVVVPSALWTSTTTGATNYWVDLGAWNRRFLNKITLGLLDVGHANIFEVSDFDQFISDQITHTTKPLSDYTYLSTQAPPASDLRLRYTLHSPLTLDLYDDLGNHTGIATSTGQVEENIPGTYFVKFGDVKYIFADNGTPQHVVMSGYDTGTFTFEVGEFLGDTIIASTVFSDIPVTPQTQVKFDVVSGFNSASDLSVDKNGDGTVDSSYASSTGEIIVSDSTPSQSTSVSGGGGGIPSLLPQAGSIYGELGRTTTSASSSSATGATSSAIVIPESQAKKPSQISVKIPYKKKIIVIATSTGKSPQLNSQVASVAQVTGDGLWLRFRYWIMNELGRLFSSLKQ